MMTLFEYPKLFSGDDRETGIRLIISFHSHLRCVGTYRPILYNKLPEFSDNPNNIGCAILDRVTFYQALWIERNRVRFQDTIVYIN